MKKILIFVVAFLLLSSTAMADSIAGKFGVTARGGASYIFDSEFSDMYIALMGGTVQKDLEPDITWTVGGGLMYGITNNLAVTFDVIYFQTDLEATSVSGTTDLFRAKTVDFALGAQWRFMPKSRFVPYIGAGFDIMWNKMDFDIVTSTNLDVDPTYGIHLNAGFDFFFTPNIALNAEIRGLYSTKGDVTPDTIDMTIAEYNPSNISGFIGVRFFFP
jgi:outer membrane protein